MVAEQDELDPARVEAILKQRIDTKKNDITALTIDMQVASASEFGNPAEIAGLQTQIVAQKDYLRLYEERLMKIKKAVSEG